MALSPIEFLAKVLPDTGVRFACPLIPSKSPKGTFVHEIADDYAHLLAIAKTWENRGPKVNIYFACAAYDQATWKEKHMPDNRVFRYPTRGRDSKVVAVRSLWEDIDVGKTSVPSYDTAKEAVKAVIDACRTIALPPPLFVYSGTGIHCYWPFTQDVSYEEWLILAELKKSAFAHAGLKIDTNRSTDIKSVLRPVGIRGSRGNTVRVLHDAGPFDYSELKATLQHYTLTNSVRVLPSSPASHNNEIGTADYPASSAYTVADHCPQVRAFRDTQGNVGYDLWWLLLGVLKFTTEGDQVCHEWSEGHPDYSHDETQSKLESWSYGPTSCARILGCNPKGCEGCAYEGKVKSPIQLGYAQDKTVINEPTPVAPPAPSQMPELDTAAHKLPDSYADVPWPMGYGINASGNLTFAMADDNGVIQHVPIASRPYFIHEHILNHDFTRTYRVVYKGPTGRWREFTLPAELMADFRAFGKAFAAHEIFFFGKTGIENGMRLIRDFASSTRKPETRQVKHMGWMYNEHNEIEDAFVIGKHVITKDSIHPIRADEGLEKATTVLGAFSATGSASVWLDLVNRMYAREGAEAHQLVILAGFASPLIELTKTNMWHGIPIALTGGTAAGKSTVCDVMSTIYGTNSALFLSGGTAGSSFKAVTQIPGIVCNLPLAFDDMSERPPEEVRDMIYHLPQGKERMVLNSNRTIRASDLYWNMIPIITSNVDFYTLLAKFGGNIKDATQVRIFEVRMKDNLGKELWPDMNVKLDVDPVLKDHHGVVGREWVRFLIKNRREVEQQLRKAQAKYAPQNSSMESAERFYADLMAAVVVAGKLLTKVLKWLDIDMARFTRWMQVAIEDNRNRRIETGHTTKDKVSSLLRFHHDAILLTRKFPQGVRGSGTPIEVGYEKPRRGVAVRIATEDRRLYVSVDAVDEWCAKHNTNKPGFVQSLLNEGFLKLTVDLARRKDASAPCRLNLGKGTSEPTGQVRCYEVDYDAVFGDDLALEKVIHIENAREAAQ